MPNIPWRSCPATSGTKTREQLRDDILDVQPRRCREEPDGSRRCAARHPEPGARDIVVTGGFQRGQRATSSITNTPTAFRSFRRRMTRSRRSCATRTAIGRRKPRRPAAGQARGDDWSIAVNGVMAGCRPEYMPILVALIEAMARSDLRCRAQRQHAGRGHARPLLNGPHHQTARHSTTRRGVLRDGFLPNTSVGRFWRLYLRNVAGFLLHKTDKATTAIRGGRARRKRRRAGGRSAGSRHVRWASRPAITRVRLRVTRAAARFRPSRAARRKRCCLTLRTACSASTTGRRRSRRRSHGWDRCGRSIGDQPPSSPQTLAKAGWSRLDVKRWHLRTGAAPGIPISSASFATGISAACGPERRRAGRPHSEGVP